MITDRKEAVEYLMKNKEGDMSTLEKEISKDLIENFKLFNYIKVDNGKNYKMVVA